MTMRIHRRNLIGRIFGCLLTGEPVGLGAYALGSAMRRCSENPDAGGLLRNATVSGLIEFAADHAAANQCEAVPDRATNAVFGGQRIGLLPRCIPDFRSTLAMPSEGRMVVSKRRVGTAHG